MRTVAETTIEHFRSGKKNVGRALAEPAPCQNDFFFGDLMSTRAANEALAPLHDVFPLPEEVAVATVRRTTHEAAHEVFA